MVSSRKMLNHDLSLSLCFSRSCSFILVNSRFQVFLFMFRLQVQREHSSAPRMHLRASFCFTYFSFFLFHKPTCSYFKQQRVTQMNQGLTTFLSFVLSLMKQMSRREQLNPFSFCRELFRHAVPGYPAGKQIKIALFLYFFLKYLQRLPHLEKLRNITLTMKCSRFCAAG